MFTIFCFTYLIYACLGIRIISFYFSQLFVLEIGLRENVDILARALCNCLCKVEMMIYDPTPQWVEIVSDGAFLTTFTSDIFAVFNQSFMSQIFHREYISL